MKTNMNKLHIIFLLKKNVQQDIIKTILGYPPIAVPEILKEWNVMRHLNTKQFLFSFLLFSDYILIFFFFFFYFR